ncbi:MAG: C25 family cysteine peptidase [Polyangiaceae bacterium]
MKTSPPARSRPRGAIAWIVAGTALVACSQPAHPPSGASTAPEASASSAEPPRSRTDYLVFVQRSFEAHLAPLVALREGEGHGVQVERLEDVYAKAPSSEPRIALRDELRRVAKEQPNLRFVLLAGDPQSEGTPLPAFTHTLEPWAAEFAGQTYVSDDDYATAGVAPLAVGRLPARSSAELSAMVSKIVAYASGPIGPWQRRVGVFAGPVGLREFDSMVEDYASDVLNGNVPYAFDLRVMFASPSSPYAFAFDRFRDEMIASLGRGSLMSVYAGHASETELSGVAWRGKRWPIGRTEDFARIDAGTSNPILVVLTCESGAYDMKRGRSIAESAILAPHGPIAVYAASAVSSAMVNFGWAESLIDAFLVKRSKTVGDGIVDARTALPTGGSALGLLSTLALDDLDAQDGPDARREHLAIYNLFGDPGTIPRYPGELPIRAPSSASAGSTVTVTLDAPDGAAELELTLETARKELKPGAVPASDLEALPLDEAFAAMSKGNASANDKVLARVPIGGSTRPLSATVQVPSRPGAYWIKVSGTLGGDEVSAATALRVE